ncbi:alpha-ribazole phosphatase [Streptomyces davaonensis JCM 4913]|uniref:Alpha-ribazole phosphatase n=1 Tax=Streptomyces davaonensis (strain DSM 101723 / JCM 4913 / KCC S-0913 / 768) TaxID=1214101 RepID=K4QXI4_STRDJ|nr:histidine phosphatase family protein [Streptomyces davaonensis]CCK25550.1 alpha-ribazole phosphatase [Streptomyces davaonensis JCM 4913]
MTIRLTLLCAAAPTRREVRFADDTPLDERAQRQTRATAPTLPAATAHRTAPSQRCRQTAEALGWDPLITEPALRDMDMGHWYGRTPEELATADPSAFAAWLSDPEAAPHGGESVADVCRRVAGWLDALPADTGRMVAVVEQSVARAAVLCALSAPPTSFWRIDVPPLGAVQLTGRAGRWNLRMGAVGGMADG